MNLAISLEGAYSGTPDYASAEALYVLAGRNGEMSALHNLGHMLWEKEGPQQDLVRAYAWLTYSADREEGLDTGCVDELAALLDEKQIEEARRMAGGFPAYLQQ
jgi:TPR repeat protein